MRNWWGGGWMVTEHNLKSNQGPPKPGGEHDKHLTTPVRVDKSLR